MEDFANKTKTSAKVPIPRLRFVFITQAAYNALGTKDANTIYFITN